MAQITLQESSGQGNSAGRFPENSPVRKKIETIEGFALEIFPKQIYTACKMQSDRRGCSERKFGKYSYNRTAKNYLAGIFRE